MGRMSPLAKASNDGVRDDVQEEVGDALLLRLARKLRDRLRIELGGIGSRSLFMRTSIATYSQAGAQFGFAIGWTMLFSYPLMVAIQQISALIGRTTGRGIASNLRKHYPNWLLQGLVARCIR
jgi:hypothetical protein